MALWMQRFRAEYSDPFKLPTFRLPYTTNPLAMGKSPPLATNIKKILEPPVSEIEINMVMAKQNLGHLQISIMCDGVLHRGATCNHIFIDS
ncbi:uncharacterized protein N7529_009271 [Penicillium soppii]|uniref:uncharacterized protein n=1 Tax=Penicillium soppii TaxID=69789 RepID=UPI00254665E2|nr:uncharacterized protein N7529_009271 [Penicillium soppii]KAJ5855327.1 hypothetical protein N7529_009271 [Penicillium soppii]